MSRLISLLILAATFGHCCGNDDLAPPMYERQPSLQQTLLATRYHYTTWLAEQPAARKLVELGPWSATPLLPAHELDETVQPGQQTKLDAKLADGRPLWTTPELPDATVARFLGGANDKAVYLTRTIDTKEPCRLTIGIGAGDRLDVWLADRKLASANTHLNVGRYGCSTRMDGTRVDQLIVDLPLQAGNNTLLVRITPGSESSFFFSITPNPVPRLWEQLRRDFPATENPLLDQVHADWFATQGWIAAKDSRFEQQFVEQAIADCGPVGSDLRKEFEQLQQQKLASSDKRWLDLCVRVSLLAKLHTDLTRLRAAVEELDLSYTDYPSDQFRARLDDYEERLTKEIPKLDPTNEPTRQLLAEMPRMQRRMLVDESPLLKNAKLLFVKRYTYNSKHYYDDFQHVSRWGGNLCELSLIDGTVREIAPELAGGVFDRYDLSFDAKRIVFGYRRPKHEGYRLYEIGVDGTGLRQITHPPENEEERIATYGKTSTGDGFYGLLGYRFWTDDVHPCYLPDGGLCFASTRSEHGVLCTPAHYLACTNLYRMEMDGTGLRPLSRGALSEFTPSVMEDGRILYNRWEYVYKGIGGVQPLWSMRPDGSGSEEFYGDNITHPGVLWQARQLPGQPGKAVAIGCGHEPFGIGQALLLDPGKSKRTPESMVSLTPNVKTRGLRGLYQERNGVLREDLFGPFYADPYPLSDKFFLVSCNPDQRYNDQDAYGIHLLDTFGNRVLIYDDPEMSCWLPMPLRPRKMPPVLPSQQPKQEEQPETATLFVGDIYRGLDGVEPGTVKYLRVMEQIPKPWSAEIDPLRGQDRAADGFGGHIAVSHNAHIWIAVLCGIVPVEEDGSACLEVPAGKNLFFQALDENYMQVQRMRTFINLEPGENRSCIGCHEHRTQAPPTRLVAAMHQAPAQLGPQPGEIAPRPLYYPTDVQPILDRHCVECHNGEDSKAEPDLRGEMTAMFNRSYENLMQTGQVNTVREWNGADHAMNNVEAVPPYGHGSHQSKLVQLLRDGHYDKKLSQEEWVKLATWIDCGAPFYGSYYGRRNLRYRGQPDFRPVPTVESACGIQPAYAKLAPPDPIPAELLAHWKLDEAPDGVALDTSAKGHEMKALGATRGEGHDGSGSLRFDGKAYLEAEGLGIHDAISIALWVKLDSSNHQWNPLLFGHEGQAGTVHFSLLPNGTPNVAVNTGDWNWTHCKAKTALAVGQWHHLVLVCDARFGGSAKFYVDGHLVGDDFLSLGLPLDLDRFRIGAWNRWENSPNNNLHGGIDNLRIYRGTLTEQEVVELGPTH
jgi:concanavalin A-like lectin/glucanase superfamily protein/hydrazine synthase alpha subunit-like protein